MKKEQLSLLYQILLGLVVVVIAIWLLLGRDKSKSKIRNVLLISIDTCRADYLSCYGYPRKTTPNIDAIAEESTLFENTITPIPLTLPAHVSMLTGTIPLYHRIRDNGYKVGESNEFISETLRQKGFATGAVISTFVMDHYFGFNQGFDYYNDHFDNPLKTTGVNQRKGDEASHYAIEWLKKRKSERFFLFLHYYDPHTDYIPPEPFASQFADNPYAGEIAYTDYCIGQVIGALKKLKLYDSTLIIITGDHGEMLGEHGESEHGYFIYESAIKVPLIFKAPKSSLTKRVTDAVSLIDIMPTICNCLGIRIPAHVQGRDLSNYFTSKAKAEKNRYLYCESLYATKYGGNSLLGVTNGQWKYIQTTRPELYNLDKDPYETKNLVHEQPKQAHFLRENLKLILEEQSNKSRNDNASTLDPESTERLRSLGYVAGGIVLEDSPFDQSKPDPKDLIRLREQNKKLTSFVLRKQYKQAKAFCLEMLAEYPEALYLREKLGHIAFESGDMNEAIVYYSDLLSRLSKVKVQGSKQDVIYNTRHKLAQAFYKLNKFEKAIVHFDEALQLKPNQLRLHSDIAYALTKAGELNKAIEHYNKALQLGPDDDTASVLHDSLAKTFVQQSKFDQAIEHWYEALKLKPNQVNVLNDIGVVLSNQGKLDNAVKYWTKSLSLDPSQAKVHKWLGNLSATRGKTYEVIKHWTVSLRINPAQPNLQDNLAKIFYGQGKFEDAIGCWTAAIKLQPQRADILNNLAWLKAVYKSKNFHDPNEAVQFALQACKLVDYKEPGFLDTLSVAYAATGKFDEAIKTAEKALNLAQSSNQQQLIDEIKNHLELYKQGQPYFDSFQ